MENYKKELIKELLERIDIVEVISSYIPIKKIGKDWYAICPFHPDTKPSLRIRDDKKVFNCFGCGAFGNVITFVSKIKNISFQEAVTSLAERYYPDITIEINREYWTEKRAIIKANAHLLFNFRKFLTSKIGKPARDYLQTRGIDEKMWGTFAIGFAPQDPYTIPNLLLKEGFDKETLIKTGSIKEIEGTLQLIFRNRILFPITNSKGEVIAFGGRVLDDLISPKYINSSESPVFRKRESFFGITQALDEIRLYGKCIITEGYIDVIALHQHGIKYAVSCLGTSITSAHIEFLRKIASDVILMFDNDDAGRRAILKNIETLVKAGIIPKICILPPGEDPDTFFAKGGKAEELQIKDGIIYYAEYLLEDPLKKNDKILLSQALAKVQSLLSIIYSDSETQAEIYIREIASKLNIQSSALRSDIKKLAKPFVPINHPQNFIRKDIPEYELEILRFATFIPESIRFVKEYIQYISSEEVKQALSVILEADGNLEFAISLADENSRKLLMEILIEHREYPEIGWENLVESTLQRLAIEKIRRELPELARQAVKDPIKKQAYLNMLKKLSYLEGYRRGKPKKKF